MNGVSQRAMRIKQQCTDTFSPRSHAPNKRKDQIQTEEL